jgi:thiamine kinase-like enzyme|tara:strand:+ start:1923 stop:2771 length:849 start_codon:yes stop_codon:yes gene_type:complete
MDKLLKRGNIEILIPERAGGGLTGETHLLELDNQKFVLRKCADLEKADFYKKMANKFEKKGFFPKMIDKKGKNVLYEFIKGRDLRGKEERLNNIEEVGKILAIINKEKFKGKFSDPFETQIRELKTGKYIPSLKVKIARKKRNITSKPKKLLTEKQAKEILNYYKSKKTKLKPEVVYDCGDPTPGNFRLRNGKVYLVDIDSIKPRYKGFGISKFFLEWGKTRNKQEKFVKGYKSKNNLNLLTEEYKDFIDLIFLVQRLNFQAQTGKETKETYEKIISLIQRR